MSNGVFENAWLKSSIDAFTAAVNKDVNTQGLSQSAAIEKNKGLLQRNTYTYLQPEQMHSFEVGYRSILLNNRLFIDADLQVTGCRFLGMRFPILKPCNLELVTCNINFERYELVTGNREPVHLLPIFNKKNGLPHRR